MVPSCFLYSCCLELAISLLREYKYVLLFNVGKRRQKSKKPLRLQRYNKKMTYANKNEIFLENPEKPERYDRLEGREGPQ